MDVASGAALFSRYAFPPNELGHCGPPGADALLTAGAGEPSVADADDELRSRAACFDGAWPYLELLAQALGTGDPLAPSVVSAYWTGGPELDRIPAETFAGMVRASFGRQPGVLARVAAEPDLLDTGPHHVFHVFVVYPWVGLLRKGGDTARKVLDQCMVRWGTVESVDGEQLAVRSSPLSWDGQRLSLAPPQPEVRRWARGEHAFVADPRPGDVVSLHWDWACDRLTPAACAELATRTELHLRSVNRWLASSMH
jgi:Family of unknown function (DUF6390)